MGGRYEGRRLRILIIEDNADTAEGLRTMLELRGYSAEAALTGPDGIEMAKTFLPEVVLCDLGLPNVDGLTVAHAMRADPLLSGTRLIALSGHTSPEDIERSLHAGFDQHLCKPADPEQILRVIRA